MSDTSENSKDKGFFLNTHGISCIPCRCKRQFYHKESKTVKEDNKITTNTVEDRRNFKFNSGRNQSPDEIFKPESSLQAGSVEICSTGWDDKQNRITPEELEERIEKMETDIDVMKKDIDNIHKFKFKME